MFEEEKNQNKLLSVINATVSHELRNPLNSIIAINFEKEGLYKELSHLLSSQFLDHKTIIRQAKQIMVKLSQNLNV